MSHTPTLDFVTHLAASIGALTAGTNLFDSPVIAPRGSFVPEAAVFVWASGGPPPQRTMGEPDEIRKAIIHYRVRHPKVVTGLLWARAIQDAARAATIAGYLEVKLLIGEPRSLGEDADGRNYFGGEVMLTYISD